MTTTRPHPPGFDRGEERRDGAVPHPLAGSAAARRYTLGVQLRITPFTQLWQARDHQLDRDVTLTVPRDELGGDEAALLIAAANSAAAELDHPNIARIFDAGTIDREAHPVQWAAGEFITGPTVDRYQRPLGSTDQEWATTVLTIAEQLAAALQYSHSSGIIHGNLSPTTVLLTGTSPTVKVVDFGPQPADLAVPSDPALTVRVWQRFTESLIYPSPEQKNGGAPTRRSDIFGFGVVIAALLLSIPAGTDEHPSALPGVDIDVADELRRIAARAMKKHPAERHHSFLVIQDELRFIRVARRLDAAATNPDTVALSDPFRRVEPVTERLDIPRSPSSSRRSPPRRRSRQLSPPARTFLILLCVLSIAGLGWWLMAQTPKNPQGQQVTIPSVAGKTLGDATALLGHAGLHIGGQRAQNDPTIASGSVSGTDPAAGSQVDPSSAVTLLVSSGPGAVAVPQLEGLSLSAAQDALRSRGLTAGAIKRSDGVAAAGTVLAANPAFGTTTAPGSSIALTIASGNQRIPSDLVGQTRQAVIDSLTRVGFDTRVFVQDTNVYATDVVLAVDPAPGTSRPLGSTVTVTVANYIPQLEPGPTGTPSASTPSPVNTAPSGAGR
jgi:beta-lactam-binding protein with PASTA domain